MDIMSGFVVDVGDLMRLVMAKEGLRKVDDMDEKLEHELCDCLWSILVLADRFGIKLEEVFPKQMTKLEEAIVKKIKE